MICTANCLITPGGSDSSQRRVLGHLGFHLDSNGEIMDGQLCIVHCRFKIHRTGFCGFSLNTDRYCALSLQISKGVVCISRIFYSAFIFIHFWALVLLILFRSVMLMSNFLDFMKDDVVAVDKIQNNKISSEMKSSVPLAGIIGLDV